jgi:putative spermidine/putrescine transport system permease protein
VSSSGRVGEIGVPRRLSRRANRWAILVLPGVVFVAAFFLAPLGEMLIRSVTDPSPSNYKVFFDSPEYSHVLLRTFWMSGLVTAICVIVGFPYAYAILTSGKYTRAVLLGVLLVSMWSSLLVRTYAWTVLLQDSGVINTELKRLGLIGQPLSLIRTTLGVVIGMSQILLPFTVLPMYAAMRRIDLGLLSAAQSLGARPARAFWAIFVPLSMPGILAGALLVFVQSLGFYITPALLGSPQNSMFSQLIVNQLSVLLNFGVASALSVILVLVTIVVLLLGRRGVRVQQALGLEME